MNSTPSPQLTLSLFRWFDSRWRSALRPAFPVLPYLTSKRDSCLPPVLGRKKTPTSSSSSSPSSKETNELKQICHKTTRKNAKKYRDQDPNMGYCGDHPMSVKSFRSGISTQCHAICRWSWGFVGRLKTAILIFNLFSGRWVNTQQLATRSGSFFGQAQAVNTNHVLKSSKARLEMPDEAPNVNANQTIGKVTK